MSEALRLCSAQVSNDCVGGQVRGRISARAVYPPARFRVSRAVAVESAACCLDVIDVVLTTDAMSIASNFIFLELGASNIGSIHGAALYLFSLAVHPALAAIAGPVSMAARTDCESAHVVRHS